jgi:hypothetical protein
MDLLYSIQAQISKLEVFRIFSEFLPGFPAKSKDTIVNPHCRLHCKTDESHVPHKFTKIQLGPMTNVISPTALPLEFCNPLNFEQMCISCAFCALTG